MKRNLLKICMILTAMLVANIAKAYDFEDDGIYYSVISLEDMTCEVSRCNIYSGEINIPAEVIYNNRTFKVTRIGEKAFLNRSGLTIVLIPDSVIYIGFEAFCNCTSLTSITIPNSVTYIGGHAFSGCTSLTSITIPSSVTRISDFVFSGCTSLTSITIPDSVTNIGESAFQRCESLTSITIPDSVTNIGESAFRGCESLEFVKLSESLQNIRYGLFANCKSLKSLEIPGSVARLEQSYHNKYGEISDYTNTFENCSNLICLKIKYSSDPLQIGYEGADKNSLVKFFSSDWEKWTETIKDVYIDRELNSNITVPNLEKLEIGEHLVKVQVKSISNLNNLTTIVCHALEPPTLYGISNWQYMNLAVSVPAAALAAYQADPVWGKFWNLQAMSVDSLHCSSEKKEIGRYDLSGTSVDANYKGLVIVRSSDGSTKKIIQ